MMREHLVPERGTYYRTNELQPDRQTLVFIHGISGSSVAWEPYEQYFGSEYNILTFDLRGHGKSLKHPRREDYTVALIVEDLHELLRSLSIVSPIIISHSFGTFIAMQYLATYEAEVRASIFISPSGRVRERMMTRISRTPLSFLAWLLSHVPLPARHGARIDYVTCPDRSDWDLRRRYVDIRNTTLRVYLYLVTEIYRHDYASMFAALTLPVLIIHGTKDTIFPIEDSQYLHQGLPGSEFVAVPDVDHILILTHREKIIEIIARFIHSLA